MALELLSMIERAQVVSRMWLLLIMLVCVSLVKEAEWWLVICQVLVLSLKP